MGWSGMYEYISRSGVYWTEPVPYDENDPPYKPRNSFGEEPFWFRMIHTTNGIDESDPATRYGKKTLVQKDKDFWCKDHYGNDYALRFNEFAPDQSEWERYKSR